MRIMMVCTGNTCRSPLAAALLLRRAGERGLEGLDVASAGIGALDGAPISEGSYLVGLEAGLDLSNHRARMLTRELVADADLILTMSTGHLARVLELGGEDISTTLGAYAGRTGMEAEVDDPFGGDLEEYRRTLVKLEALVGDVAARLDAET